ncbi:hypothetical protein LEP1GSC150_0060 [Leptospira interrogans serovar Copenhageni str. LT2050]|uniref:Tetrapyrrole methylase domain-containing protein n=1 Tax=Leptospira interrogans serovar Copenhageni str. LT2050 TaxID=1001598 RepID=M3GD93_LEPIT|nr:hypothetical protein LEP1GSC150_0060 [Leptospira interrogans serovar Copenhageni str. LT2050]
MKIEFQKTLVLVSVSLGNPGDLTARARELLEHSDILIGEESQITSKLLKSILVSKQFFFVMNILLPKKLEILGKW